MELKTGQIIEIGAHRYSVISSFDDYHLVLCLTEKSNRNGKMLLIEQKADKAYFVDDRAVIDFVVDKMVSGETGFDTTKTEK